MPRSDFEEGEKEKYFYTLLSEFEREKKAFMLGTVGGEGEQALKCLSGSKIPPKKCVKRNFIGAKREMEEMEKRERERKTIY